MTHTPAPHADRDGGEPPRPYVCRHGKTRTEHYCDDHRDHLWRTVSEEQAAHLSQPVGGPEPVGTSPVEPAPVNAHDPAHLLDSPAAPAPDGTPEIVAETALSRPNSASGQSGASRDENARESGEVRLRAYAEAVLTAVAARPVGVGERENIVRAVMAVADAEQESLRRETREAARQAFEADRAALRAERDALAATLAEVRAKAAEWQCGDEWCEGDDSGCAYAQDVFAILDADAPETAKEGHRG